MTDCYCEYDYDPPEFLRVKIVRARKQHICGECKCSIKPGESYERVVGKWDGNVLTLCTCAACREFRDWYETNRPCFCWAYGEMYQAVREDCWEAGSDMLKEAPGFLFEVGRRYVKIRNRARIDKAARKASKNASESQATHQG